MEIVKESRWFKASEVCNYLVVNGHSYFDSDVVVGFVEHINRGFGSNLPENELSPDYKQKLSQYTSLPNIMFNKFFSDPL